MNKIWDRYRIDKILLSLIFLFSLWLIHQGLILWTGIIKIETMIVEMQYSWVIPPPVTEPNPIPLSMRFTQSVYTNDIFVYEDLSDCYITYYASLGDNLAIVWLFFYEWGFSPQAISGIIGNLQIESFDEINPRTLGDLGMSFGIAQWNRGRLDNLRDFSDMMNRCYGDLYSQLHFMMLELYTGQDVQWWRSTTGIECFEGLRTSSCIVSATTTLSQVYHRPGRPNLGVSGGVNRARIPRAEQAFERFYVNGGRRYGY